jgi:hypothetical protein
MIVSNSMVVLSNLHPLVSSFNLLFQLTAAAPLYRHHRRRQDLDSHLLYLPWHTISVLNSSLGSTLTVDMYIGQ